MNKLEETINDFFLQNKIAITGQKLVVAVSGGPDSMALLAGLNKVSASKNTTLIVAHVDHELRADSKDEAKLIHDYCSAHGLIYEQANWPIADHPQKGVEAAAREFRYNFFAKVAKKYESTIVVTAHHGDDLLENVLMKLIRSGDLREMTRPLPVSVQNDLTILRPLLGCSKAELVAYCAEQQIAYITDSTNSSDFTLRNRVRHHLVPQLRAENELILQNVGFMQQQLQQLLGAVTALTATLPQPKVLLGFHDGILIGKRDAISGFEVEQQALIYEQFIAQYLHKSVKVDSTRLAKLKKNDSNQVFELKQKVKIILYQNFYYLVDGALLAKNNAAISKTILVGQEFEYGKRTFVVTTEELEVANQQYVLRGKFKAEPTNEFYLRQVAERERVLLSDGSHQLLKKRFSPVGIPASLRTAFFGIADKADNRLLWIDQAYANQLLPKSVFEYRLYEVLKKTKEK